MTGVNVDRTGPSAASCADPPAAVLIYATFPGLAAAERIGGELVKARLAACVNIVPGMRSIYRWQGAVHRDEEVVAIIKSRAALASRVVGWVRVAHPYTNPALVTLPVTGGSADFLGWIVAETGDDATGC
jgi:periplasmic divalent cation tolerance protein